VFFGFHRFVALYEEPELLARSGDSDRRHLDEVPRWIPRPPG
jgi:protein-S-isoprenylcysteine O-methyltransferase Ste14